MPENDPLTSLKIEVAVLKDNVANLKDEASRASAKADIVQKDLRAELKEETQKIFRIFYWLLTAGGSVILAAVIKWALEGGLAGG